MLGEVFAAEFVALLELADEEDKEMEEEEVTV